MSEIFPITGNIAGPLNVSNEDDVDNARAFGTIYVDKYNPKTQKYDKSEKRPFTAFGRDALNLADSVEAFIADNDDKKPRVIALVRLGSYEEEGENRKGETVDKTRYGLTLVESGLSNKWHVTTGWPDDHAGSGGSSKSGNRRRRKDDEPVDEEPQNEPADEPTEEQPADEPATTRSRSSSRGSSARSGGSARASSGGSSRARSGGSRARAGSGARRR